MHIMDTVLDEIIDLCQTAANTYAYDAPERVMLPHRILKALDKHFPGELERRGVEFVNEESVS